MNRYRVIFVPLFVLLISSLSGCDLYRYRQLICGKYNEKTDTFSFLVVYTHFEADTQNAVLNIVKFWEAREKYLFGFGLSGEGLDKVLDEVTITPGNFFRGPDDTLCYSHRIDFPGSIIDRYLRAVQPSKGINDQINVELKRRRDGGAVESWDKLREAILALTEQVDKDPNKLPVVSAPTTSVWMYLTAESLQKLSEAAVGEKLHLRRTGKAFSLTLPVAEADGLQIKKIHDEVRELIRKDRKNNAAKLSSVDLLGWANWGQSEVATRGDQVTFSFQLPLPIETAFSDDKPRTPDQQRKQAATLDLITKKHKIPLQEHLDVDSLLTHFRNEDYRTWKSKSGLVQHDALFVSKDPTDATKVRLRFRSNGKTETAAIANLSAEDQAYVQAR